MTVQFPKQAPRRDQLDLPRAALAELLQGLRMSLLTSTSAVMSADTANDLAGAVANIHQRVSEAQSNLTNLVDITRSWR